MISGANYREGVALSPDGAVYVQLASGSTVDSPTFTGTITGAEKLVAEWAVPMIVGPTGTMANNGAVTWGTALSNAYTSGAWVIMPAGSIATGVPAATAILWYVGTNTTTGTFYNSTYTSGTPGIGVTTAFATTGPGAFTGVTTEVTGPVITIPAGGIGANGVALYDVAMTCNNTVGTKVTRVRYSGAGGNIIYSVSMTTVTSAGNTGLICNRGVTNAQVCHNKPTSVADSTGTNYQAVDTTAATTIAITLQRGTATDVQVLEFGRVQLSYAA